MKKIIIAMMAMVMPFLLTGCFLLTRQPTPRPQSQNQTTSVESVRPGVVRAIPSSYAEFESLYNKIGDSREGCVTLQLVAMEMYRRNSNIGARCLKLINTDTNYTTMMRRLPEIFREGDSYARPYLVASYFEGASPENGYNPSKPYRVDVQENPNQRARYSEMLQGTTYPMQVYCYGADTPWRSITLIKLDGESRYLIQDSAGLTAQCKQIHRTQTFRGL